MNRELLICLAIGCLTIVLFAPAGRHDFINYDDPRYPLEPIVQRGLTLDGVRWAFTTFNFANYHPITWLSHMLDAQLFGKEPGGHHVHSVVLHALNAVVLFLVLLRLTGQRWQSAAVATLWAVHPLRVESVAWASERKDLLCLLFFLLSIAAYVRWVTKRSAIAYAAMLLLFALSLMSKSMSVSLPIVLMLLDWWPLKRPMRWALLWEKLPAIAMSIAFAIVTMIAQRQGGAMSESIYPLPLRLANAIASYGRYLFLSVWPTKLAFFYPYHGALPGTTLPASTVILSAAALLAITAFAAMMWRRERGVLIGWLWFVITLIPTLGLVQVGQQSMADRYTYLPHIGLMIAIVFGIGAFLRSRASLEIPAAAVAVIIMIALSIRAYDQVRHWRNNTSLYTHALQVTSHNHVAHSQLGMELLQQERLPEAIDQYKKAIAIKPAEAQPYYNVGVVLHRMERRAEAKSWYLRALDLYPHYPEALVGVGNVLFEQGRDADAIPYYREAVEYGPQYFTAQYNLGLALANLGHVAEALPYFAEAARLSPQSAMAHLSYGMALEKQGRADEAHYEFTWARGLAIEQGNAEILARAERQLSPPASVPSTTKRSL